MDSTDLDHLGIRNRFVDSASIEVNRRARRAKTDRIDLLKLCCLRGANATCGAMCGCLPSRRKRRDRSAAIARPWWPQTRAVNQMRSWLSTFGARWPTKRQPASWTKVTV